MTPSLRIRSTAWNPTLGLAGLLVFFCLFPSARAAEAEPNLIANPSFEQGTEQPAGWQALITAGATLERVTSMAHTGSAAIHIRCDAQGAKEYPAFKFRLDQVKPGEQYRGSVWVRTQGLIGRGGFPVIEYNRGNERLSYSAGQNSPLGDSEWRQLIIFGEVPEGTTEIFFCLMVHGQGDVYFDDARLERVKEAPPPFNGDRLHLTLHPERVLCPDFLGCGAQGDYFLTCDFNTSHGVTQADRDLVNARVAAMRPQLMRTFFNYKWWEPEEGRQTPDSQEMRDYVGWCRFLKSIDCQVLVNPFGDYFAYSSWMQLDPSSKLPGPAKREAMVRSLVDLLEHLRHKEGLDNVRYVALMNEPDNDDWRRVDPDEFVRLYRLLDHMLRQRGLRDEIRVIAVDGSDWSLAYPGTWFHEIVTRGLDYADACAVHTYGHKGVPSLMPWIRSRRELIQAQAPAGRPPLPLMITEFNTYGDTFTNPENHTYENGLFLADFAVTALREGTASVLMWCLFDTQYDDQHRQEYGLWRYKDADWAPRPGFYSWSLLTRFTRRGSRIVAVESEPAAPGVRAVALVSPEGKQTVLAVNRYHRPIEVKLTGGSSGPIELRRYEFTRTAVAQAGAQMLSPAGILTLGRDAPPSLILPAESFVLLTELE